MKQLLEIQTIPMVMEFRISPAKIQRRIESAQVSMSRNKGGLKIHSRMAKLNLDSYESRSSVVPSLTNSIKQYAQAGIASAHEATANYAEEGNLMSNTLNKDAIIQIIYNRLDTAPKDFNIAFIPDTPVNISYVPPELSMQYDMDKLNFKWKTGGIKDFKYTPPSIEYNIKQYPRVIIKYVGSPNYVPPSADPDYTPIDTKA